MPFAGELIHLEYCQRVDFKEVILESARREKVSPSGILSSRAPLPNAPPRDTMWFSLSTDKDDLGSLKVINSGIGWQIVSGRARRFDRGTIFGIKPMSIRLVAKFLKE